jgi:hypothetical protein
VERRNSPRQAQAIIRLVERYSASRESSQPLLLVLLTRSAQCKRRNKRRTTGHVYPTSILSNKKKQSKQLCLPGRPCLEPPTTPFRQWSRGGGTGAGSGGGGAGRQRAERARGAGLAAPREGINHDQSHSESSAGPLILF